jgi:UDP-N-acetyl-D-glucosamine dehydrogenase
MYAKNLKKIKSKQAIIGIIGLGYVGLPLSKSFTNQSIKVIGFDIDEAKITSLDQGKSYIKHISNDAIAEMKDGNLFQPTSEFSKLSDVDVIIICVPTPLSKSRDPDLSPVLDTAKTIAKYIKKGQLIILESSTYPATTDEELGGALELSGLTKGIDFFIAYSPEREDPGNKVFSTSTIPKIVGADTKESRDLAVALYESIISKVITVSSSRTAEAVKLTENIFRSVNIALVNELKVIFDAMGIDIWEVVDAAATKPFGYMPFYPGPGLGGHCIPIDPFYLTYKAREFGISTKFIELAGEINTFMPAYVVSKLGTALNNTAGKAISGSRILLLGLSYKKDIDDTRETPTLVIMKHLISLGSTVDFHDPFVEKIGIMRDHPELQGKYGVSLDSESLKNYDAVVICTDHSMVDYSLIGNYAKLIVDTRNAMSGLTVTGHLVKA